MLLGELHRRLFGSQHRSSFATLPILTRTFELVTPSPVPHLLPGCLITSSSSAENGFAIAGIIASIIYETSMSSLFV